MARTRWAEAALPLVLALVPFGTADAQLAPRPVGEVIDRYVQESLESNLALKSESLEVERNLAALDAARAKFFPEISLAARYSRADGGREIDVPLGTLLNPIYSSLNQLLAAQGQPAQFPTITDQKILFQREREQDTRLALRQPIYAPAIPAAIRAQRAQLESSEFGRVALARRLKRDVTVAYLDWAKASKSVDIVQASLSLLEENLRVNESLFRNGKVTQDQVLRARAEMLAVVQQLREARNAQSQARSYLNFLRNHPLDEELIPATVDGEVKRTVHDLTDLRAAALSNRPELQQLDRAAKAAESREQLARADLKPTLSLGVDGGTQGEGYDFGRGNNFAMVSLVVSWRFFDGGANRAEARSARAAALQALTRKDEVALQIQLEVQQALDRLETTSDSLTTAQARAEAARAGFRIASRKRDEGVITQVEFIDARSSLTSAELNLNVTTFDLLAREAELDYATAAGPLPLDLVTGK
ncbi:MAG TPA: TolC family protein [Steroidobacteraceae bacterium]|nr:TolC family protein [Steroidobacteraceae bacterium]